MALQPLARCGRSQMRVSISSYMQLHLFSTRSISDNSIASRAIWIRTEVSLVREYAN